MGWGGGGGGGGAGNKFAVASNIILVCITLLNSKRSVRLLYVGKSLELFMVR